MHSHRIVATRAPVKWPLLSVYCIYDQVYRTSSIFLIFGHLSSTISDLLYHLIVNLVLKKPQLFVEMWIRFKLNLYFYF